MKYLITVFGFWAIATIIAIALVCLFDIQNGGAMMIGLIAGCAGVMVGNIAYSELFD
jgi:hypothetical protein